MKRSSLKKQAKELSNLINICLEDSSRCAGDALEPGSEELIHLGAYLIVRYRLPHENIHYFYSSDSTATTQSKVKIAE